MASRVEIARRAEADLEELYLWVVDRAPQQGARWFNGLERATVDDDRKMVRVLHVRRGARQRPMAEELRETKGDGGIGMKKRARRLYDGNPSAVVAQRGDIVYTADVIDLQRLQTFFPAVTLLAV